VVALSALFNHASVLVIWVIDTLIRLSSHLPGTWYVANWRAPWIGTVAFFSLLGLCLAGYTVGWRRERGGFWPPLAIVVLAFVFGVKFG
jgi:hypothetical protein